MAPAIWVWTWLARSASAFLMNIGVARQRAVVVELVDVQLALPLDREEQPRLARMNVEMARAEAEPVAALRSKRDSLSTPSLKP